jgi:hypothetical protein
MAIDKHKIAAEIDSWVNNLIQGCTSRDQEDERILENMYDYMPLFKQLLDNCSSLEIDLLVTKYEGFYRFANLLERMAQGIRDGVISVPKDEPAPKRKRPSKPKRKKGGKRAAKPDQIRRDISFLPTYTEIIIGEIAHTNEQIETFNEITSKPHVLDDATVDRAIKLYKDQLDFIPLHVKQLNWWLSESHSEALQFQVEDLKSKLPILQAKTEALLVLLAEIKKGTIDRIMEMSDEELARKTLSGEIKRP